MKPLWHGGMKVCSIGPGHMTRMAAVTRNRMAIDLETQCAAFETGPNKFVQMMTLG